MRFSFKFGEKEYVGDYNQEYRNVGLLKVKNLEEALKERKENMSKVHIKENNRFWSFVAEQALSEDEAIDNKYIATIYDYKRIMNGIRHIKYIDKSDYEKIEKVLNEKIDGSKKDKDLSHLKEYINEFALIVMYAKNRCFVELDKYRNKLDKVLSDVKKREIRNFYADMASTGVDIDKITITFKEGDNLDVDVPILIKMMLYSFAREYYTFIEKADEEHWEDELRYTLKDTKSGPIKDTGSLNIKALIKVYIDFMHSEGVFNKKTSDSEKYLIIGRLLTIAGLEKYDINNDRQRQKGYGTETVFYRNRIKRRI